MKREKSLPREVRKEIAAETKSFRKSTVKRFLIVIPIALVCFGIAIWGFTENAIFTPIIFMGIGLLAFYLACELTKEYRVKYEAKIKYLEEHPYHKAEDFYKICVDAGINDLVSAEDKARAKLLAQKNSLPGDLAVLVELFNLGRNETLRLERDAETKKMSDELKKIEQQEAALEAANKRYIDLIGTEKTVAVYTDILRNAKAQLQKVEAKYEAFCKKEQMLHTTGTEKEIDWALHGGVATGIAGGAAGLATAIDAQQRNVAIRERNAQYSKAVSTLAMPTREKFYNRMSELESLIKHLQKKIESAQMLLVEQLPEDRLLTMLAPQVTKTEITETGATLFTISTQKPDNLLIYDTVRAEIDGSIRAVVVRGKTKIENVVFSLPTEDFIDHNITAICRTPLGEEGSYDVVFEPIHLWARELEK